MTDLFPHSSAPHSLQGDSPFYIESLVVLKSNRAAFYRVTTGTGILLRYIAAFSLPIHKPKRLILIQCICQDGAVPTLLTNESCPSGLMTHRLFIQWCFLSLFPNQVSVRWNCPHPLPVISSEVRASWLGQWLQHWFWSRLLVVQVSQKAWTSHASCVSQSGFL